MDSDAKLTAISKIRCYYDHSFIPTIVEYTKSKVTILVQLASTEIDITYVRFLVARRLIVFHNTFVLTSSNTSSSVIALISILLLYITVIEI